MRCWVVLGLASLFPVVHPAAADKIGSANYNLLALTGPKDNGCTESDCIAVVLIHGIHGTTNDPKEATCHLTDPAATDCYWQPLIDHLRTQPSVWPKIRIYVFRYMSNVGNSTVAIGDALRTQVDNPPADCANCQELKRPFIIVAHSMGGIVARQFMNSPLDGSKQRGADLISGVITLATPHHGTPLANLALRNNKARRLAGYNPRCINTTMPCQDPASLLNWGDSIFWNKYNAPDQVTNADLPNRADLLSYAPHDQDDFFLEERKNLPAPQEVNTSLGKLERDALPDDSRRLILYGSSVDTHKVIVESINDAIQGGWDHLSLKATAYLAADRLHSYFSDGLVPLASALKEGDHMVNLRRLDLQDYDHLDMYGNSLEADAEKKLDLFSRVTVDIDAIVRFGTIPPRLVRLDVSSAVAAAGTTVTLTYRIRNGSGKSIPAILKASLTGTGNQTKCDPLPATIPASDKGDVIVTRSLPLPSDFTAGPVSVIGEILPAAERNPCATSLLPTGSIPALNLTSLHLFVQPAFTTNPTVSLSLAQPGKLDYRIGETAQLKMTTTEGTLAPPPSQTGGETTLASLVRPSVSIFLWAIRPNGEGRYYYLDSTNKLRESALPTPVTPPAPAINYPWDLPAITIHESMLAGPHSWHAAIYKGEVFTTTDQLAAATPVRFNVSLDHAPDPSVVAISTPILVYEPGDQMVIDYSTRRGNTNVKYDLMLRITSRGTGNIYYFYDDSTDTNRWIHRSARPMQTLVPLDGDASIPSGAMPPILIANDTPSGKFDMKAYFSLPGKNTQVGVSANWTFVLDTPASTCFIATAAFGSSLDSSVMILRKFRDAVLLGSRMGDLFVNLYYRYSPRIAEAIRARPFARKIVRTLLWPVVMLSSVWLATGTLGALFVVAMMLLAFGWLFRRYPQRTAVTLALMLCLGVMRAAEIRGSVVRSQPFPAPVVGAKVTIANSTLQTATGPDGTFRLQNLKPGNYQVQASAPGFQSASIETVLGSATAIQSVVVAVAPTGARTYEYYLPHTAETDGWWTFFAVTNSGYTGADVAFTAFSASGQYLGTSTKLTRININHQFAGSPSSFFSSGMETKAAWYKLTSSAPLVGIEMFGSKTGTFAGLPLTTASNQSLFLPHIAVDSQWWTGISLVSGWVRAANVVMETRDGLGATLASASRVGVLKPGEKTVDQLQNYFGWDYPRASQWVSIRSDGPITGFELFGTQDFQMMAAVPATGSGSRRLFFPHVATSSGWWTGVAILNVGSVTATVKLTVYGADGSNLGTANGLTLSPGQRTVNQLPSYFDRWPANAKYVELSSDSDLIAFELVGNSELRAMGGMTAFTSAGAELAYPFIESDSDWETTVQVANVSSVTAQVTLNAFDGSGAKLAESIVNLPARAVREGTMKTLFGRALPDARSVRARSNGGALAGYSSLARIKGQGFADFPAQLVIQTSASPTSGSAIPILTNLSRVIDAVRFEPDPSGGIRVSWPSEVDAEVRILAGGQVRSGDVVVSVNGFPVNLLPDLRTAYLKNRESSAAPVQVRRGNAQTIVIEVRNPAPAPLATTPRSQ